MTPITDTVTSDPEATRWHVVANNLNPHPSESFVRFVAKHDGIEEDLGEKSKSGRLKSMAIRAAFLSKATHQIVFHYTSKHASWMNLIAMWFSILETKISAFIAYFNTTDVWA